MNQIQLMRVVVASPGDAQAERDALPLIVDELNRTVAADRNLRLELFRWETDAHPGFHFDGPQGLIDPILRIEDSDILIGIFWKRFGTPVKDVNSGTGHEFKLAYKAWQEKGSPQIFVYFNQQPYAPKSSKEVDQWRQVLEFKESFPQEGLWWAYDGRIEFENLVRRHLAQFIRNRFPLPSPTQFSSATNAAETKKQDKKPSSRGIDELIADYHSRLAERVSRVRLFGELELRPLEKAFVELTIIEEFERPSTNPQNDDESRKRKRRELFARNEEQYGESDKTESEKTKRTLKPDELLSGRTKAAIVGEPGCGKTTLLRYLAWKTLQEGNRLPVFLELNSISEADLAAAKGKLEELLFEKAIAASVKLDMVERESLRAHFIARLAAGEATILLDGLDEVSGRKFFSDLCQSVNEFLHSPYRANDLIISTRPYALQTRFDELKEMEIAPFGQRQIEQFLNHYYQDDPKARQLLTHLRHRRELRELTRVPFLLAVIAHLYRRQGELVGERLELYRQIVQHLVVLLDSEKPVERFRLPDPDGLLKRDFLRHLAYAGLFADKVEKDSDRLVFTGERLIEEAKCFCQSEGLEIDKAWLLAADVKATPLLREVGTDAYAFTHLTVQEYLAATALAKRDDCERIFCRAYFNRTLVEMEVLPMTLGLASQPDTLYEALEQLPDSLSYANLRLRARGLAYGAKASQPFLKKLVVHLSQFIPVPVSLKDPYADAVFLSFSGISGKALDDIVDFIAPFLHKRGSYDCGVAAEILGKLGGEKAVNILIETVKTGSAGVCADAAEALGEIGDERALDVLLEFLNSDTTWKTCVAIGKIGGEKGLQGLVDALKSDKRSVRFDAILGLWRVDEDGVIDALLEALNDEYDLVRWWAAVALGDLGYERAVEGLIQALKSDDSQLRWNAAGALGKIGGEKAIEALLSSLGSGDYYERMGAALALGQLGMREATGVLFEVLKKDNDNRWNASSALARIGGERVVEGLIEALNDKDPYLSRHAARALAMIGSHKAKEGLHTALKANDKYLPLRAALELAAIGDKQAVEVLVNALDWETDEGGRREIIEALGEVGDARAVAGLVEELSTNNISLRRRAAKLLEEMPQEALVEGLFESLSHQNSFVRKKAAEVICYYAL